MTDDKKAATTPCTACDHSGFTVDYRWIEGILYLVFTAGSDHFDQDRGRDIHPWLLRLPLPPAGLPVLGYSHIRRPTKALAALTDGLAGYKGDSLGYGGGAVYTAMKKLIAAAGLPEDWGICGVCKGAGEVPDA